MDHFYRLRNLIPRLKSQYIAYNKETGFATYLEQLVPCQIHAQTPDERSAQASMALNVKGQVFNYLRLYVLSSDQFWATLRELDKQYRRQNLKGMDPVKHQKVVLVCSFSFVII